MKKIPLLIVLLNIALQSHQRADQAIVFRAPRQGSVTSNITGALESSNCSLIDCLEIQNSLTVGGKSHLCDTSVKKIKAKKVEAKNVHVSGDQDICGDLNVDGLIFTSSLDVLDTLRANIIDANTINVDNATINNGQFQNINVTNNETIGGNLSVAGNETIGGNLTTSSLDVLNNATINKNLTTNSLNVVTDETVGGSLTVTNNGTFGGNLTANSLNVLNNATISALDVVANETIGGSLTVANSGSFGTNLIVARNLNTSSLDVVANETVGGNLLVTGSETVGGNSSVAGNETVGGNLSVTGFVSSCDSIVGCNLSLRDSTTNAIGNIIKNGLPFIHTYPGSASGNTFVGQSAGNFTNTGTNNYSLGKGSLHNLTSGTDNIAIGDASLSSVTTGIENIAIGTDSTLLATTARQNIAIGSFALSNDVTGSFNVCLGHSTLYNCKAGQTNLALGNNALLNLSGGVGNIAIGDSAGESIINGDNNIYIGVNLGGGADESNIIRLGGNNTARVVIPGINNNQASGNTVNIDGSGNLGLVFSSKRFKDNIRDINSVSGLLMKLRPVIFNYKQETINDIQYGLIAEEVAQVMPELVAYDNDGNVLTVRYQFLYALLLNEIQKNHANIQDQEDAITTLKDTINSLIARIVALETV